MRSRYLRPDEDVLNTEREAMQLQEGSEEATQSREKLVGHAPTIQLLTGVDEAKLGGPKLRLVQHSTEQLARTEHHLQQAQSTSQHPQHYLGRTSDSVMMVSWGVWPRPLPRPHSCGLILAFEVRLRGCWPSGMRFSRTVDTT